MRSLARVLIEFFQLNLNKTPKIGFLIAFAVFIYVVAGAAAKHAVVKLGAGAGLWVAFIRVQINTGIEAGVGVWPDSV